MRSLQDEIVKLQQELICPICSKKFELKDIKVQPTSELGVLELIVTCSSTHNPLILLVPVNLKKLIEIGPITQSELSDFYQKMDQVKDIQELIKSK